jgi:hypothetical protein
MGLKSTISGSSPLESFLTVLTAGAGMSGSSKSSAALVVTISARRKRIVALMTLV